MLVRRYIVCIRRKPMRIRCISLHGRPMAAPTYSIKNDLPNSSCRIPYTERKLSDSYNAGPHGFNSSFGKQYVRQLGTRPCRATGRAVLLDFRLARSIRHEIVSGDSPPNSSLFMNYITSQPQSKHPSTFPHTPLKPGQTTPERWDQS